MCVLPESDYCSSSAPSAESFSRLLTYLMGSIVIVLTTWDVFSDVAFLENMRASFPAFFKLGVCVFLPLLVAVM